MTMQETLVFIDSGYLVKIAKEFNVVGKYDINQLGITFAKENNLWCKNVYYYLAPPYLSNPPKEIEKIRKNKYDKFISKLKKIPSLIIREGRCQKTNEGYKQKGVDTLLTMDLSSINPNEINIIIIITSDTDFVPILKKLKENKIKIILYNYTDRVRNSQFSLSNHLIETCNLTKQIKKEHFEKSKLKN